MLISADRVHEIFMDCLFREDESRDSYLLAHGLTVAVGLHPDRTEGYADEIHEILLNLPEAFQENTGGGYSFLYMTRDKEDNLCMEQTTAQELLMLGLATGWASLPMPRVLWPALPGGVPYVMVNKERDEVKAEHE